MKFEVIDIKYEEYTELQEIKREKRIEVKEIIDINLPLAYSSYDNSFGCLFNINDKIFEIEFDYNHYDDGDFTSMSIKEYEIIEKSNIDYALKYKIDYEIFKGKFSKYLKLFNENFGE